MKYDNLNAFEKHVAGAAPDHFSNLYVILGKETFDTESAATILIDALLPEQKNRDLSLRILEGGGVNCSELLTELNSISFLTPKKVFLIHHVDKMKKVVQEEIEKYILKPHRTHYLVFTGTSLHKGSSFYKKAEKAGIVLELPELKVWEKEKRLAEWVGKLAAQERKTISYQTCQLLVKTIGLDQGTLAQEMEKLFCYVGERKEISPQDMAAICSNLHVNTIWELGESIFLCETAKALTIFRTLLNAGEDLLPLLRQIRSQFQTGFQTASMLAVGATAADITQEFPYLKGQILERHLQRTTFYGMDRFRSGLLAIDETELHGKNSQVDESLLADLLIIKLTKV